MVPRLLISDAAKSIHVAWAARYAQNPAQKHAAHAAGIRLAGNTNKTERFNRELGRLTRAAPFVPKPPPWPSARLFFDFFRPRSSLDGKTPADAAGIVVDYDKRVLLQRAHARKISGQIGSRAGRALGRAGRLRAACRIRARAGPESGCRVGRF